MSILGSLNNILVNIFMFNEFNRFKFLAALLLSLHFSLLSAMPLEDVNKWKADLAFYQDMLEKKHISLSLTDTPCPT